MMPKGSARFKLWLAVVAVFVLGCVTGALLDSAYRLRAANARTEGRGRRESEEVFEKMRRDLNLTEEQAASVRKILDSTRDSYRELRAETRPRFDAIRQSARTRIRALLTPEQQQRFDAKVAEMDAHRAAEEK
ncbi:MAG: motif family protein [Acidobacteriota bacterium]|jgi:Spy/CpxP family protein refolding chaperone|nr:motif family protein [Acidobacteriota bacterium]